LKAQGVRVEANVTDETVGYKIRQAEKEKVPYMVVIGDKEVESGKLTVRVKGIEGQTEYSVEDFATEIIIKTKDRK
jgi:threonyl-tRNA synthetase